jgi:N-acetylglucosamine-6-phosphate deacetylase
MYRTGVTATTTQRSTVFMNGLVYQHSGGVPMLADRCLVRVSNGTIVQVGSFDPTPSDDVMDLHGRILAPGFIDVQCNGAMGIDLLSEPERLWEFASVLPRWGVTTVLPTLITSPPETRRRLRETFLRGPTEPLTGADIAGLHFEGPFLNPTMKGAHPAKHLTLPSVGDIDDWTAHEVALVTIAPELDGALAVIEKLVSRGVVVSIGHSNATSEQVNAAFALGARSVTHLFNAMSPLHHRRPGVVGAVFAHHVAFASLICDGVHVVPSVVALAHQLLGARLVLISDAVGALGLSPGTVKLGDVELTITERDVQLADGTLAGSNLSMDQAVRNLMLFTGCNLPTAIHAATTAPASLLGHPQIGTIAVGARANFVELDHAGNVFATWISGSEAFRSC